jgi:hypothetical protein
LGAALATLGLRKSPMIVPLAGRDGNVPGTFIEKTRLPCSLSTSHTAGLRRLRDVGT